MALDRDYSFADQMEEAAARSLAILIKFVTGTDATSDDRRETARYILQMHLSHRQLAVAAEMHKTKALPAEESPVQSQVPAPLS